MDVFEINKMFNEKVINNFESCPFVKFILLIVNVLWFWSF